MTASAEQTGAVTAGSTASEVDVPPLENAAHLAQAWRRRISQTAALAGAEAELAARSVPAIVVLVLLAGGLALCAWLTFVVGIAWVAVDMGVPVEAVASVTIVVHAVLAAAALRRAEILSTNLSLPRLRASVSVASPESDV